MSYTILYTCILHYITLLYCIHAYYILHTSYYIIYKCIILYYTFAYTHTQHSLKHSYETDLTQKLMILNNDKESESENQIKLLRPIAEACVQNTPPRRRAPAVRVSCTNWVTLGVFRLLLFPVCRVFLQLSRALLLPRRGGRRGPAPIPPRGVRPAGPRVLDSAQPGPQLSLYGPPPVSTAARDAGSPRPHPGHHHPRLLSDFSRKLGCRQQCFLLLFTWKWPNFAFVFDNSFPGSKTLNILFFSFTVWNDSSHCLMTCFYEEKSVLIVLSLNTTVPSFFQPFLLHCSVFQPLTALGLDVLLLQGIHLGPLMCFHVGPLLLQILVPFPLLSSPVFHFCVCLRVSCSSSIFFHTVLSLNYIISIYRCSNSLTLLQSQIYSWDQLVNFSFKLL